MAETTLTINFSRPFPLFPLSSCVLLPHVAAPLHVFEPRYRQMASEALDSMGLIAMAVFDGEVSEQEYLHGRPALRPMICVGYVTQYEPLADGRYLLLLQGICRATLLDEVDHEPYRMAMLEPVDLDAAGEDELGATRAVIEELLDDPVMAQLESVDELKRLIDASIPTEALIELVTARLYADGESMYRVLSETDARKRADWLIMRLQKTRAAGGRDGQIE